MAPSCRAKHRSSRSSTSAFTPRIRTPWFRTSRTPASSIAIVASATSGVTDWAALTWVWIARFTPRRRAVRATRPTPSTTSGCSQCCGRPIRALVASRMSRMLSISSSRSMNDSRFFHGMFATSPPETTTSRTSGELRRYSIIASSRSTGLRPNFSLVMTAVELPTRSILVQCPQYCGQVGSSSARTLVG